MRHTISLFFMLASFIACSASLDHQRQRGDDKSIECSRQKFKTHDSRCCPNTAKEIFNEGQLAACKPKRSDKDAIKWANNYMLNSIQSQKKQNRIDTLDPKTLGKLCSAADYLNCVFKSNGLLFENGSINYKFTTFAFSQFQVDSFWGNTIAQGESQFAFLAESVIPDEVKYLSCPGMKKEEPSRTISTIPLLWTQIVNGAFITQCPNASTSKSCEQTAEKFNVCIKQVESFILGRPSTKNAARLMDIFKFETKN